MTNERTPNHFPLRLLAAVSMLEAFVTDRIMKYVASTSFQDMDRAVNPIIDVTYHENMGLIGNLDVPLPLILLLVITAITFVGRQLWNMPEEGEKLRVIALGMILGGAFGNLLDRLFYGYVIDWILIGGTSVINLADISIASGALLYLFGTNIPKIDTTTGSS